MSEDDLLRRQRERMVQEIAAHGVQDERVLEAMRLVPRHRFVPEAYRDHAYEDRPQPIGNEQTISQPLIVAQMSAFLHLRGDEKVLEIGTGSGYQTALLCLLAREVVSVERQPAHSARATELLNALDYRNALIFTADGTNGFPSHAPYDRILVAAGAPQIPPPLLRQLAPDGRLVIPVGARERQRLLVVHKDAARKLHEEHHGDCLFVPLIGQHGWE
jgi:protein-L-isoaspartate(D-aspartate) O-methyltransferase